ncbi:MAG: protein kinase [Gammaproteobacteria bacterium]|jgi:serine/threonine-protein kinase
MTIGPGSKFGHYEITGSLGAGGMGEVWRARDTKLDREVAIKTLPSTFADDADRLARFEREAKLLASLNHANIAAVYGLDEHEGVHFLAMELVEGETLEERLKSGALPVEDALHIALQIAHALEAAHASGIVHRDLKPANIMISGHDQVKVLDFGLAKAFAGNPMEASPAHSPALSVAMTQAGLILGTAGYMSPEQASGQATDQRADIWAFGVVLYEMLTGLPLFSGESVPHVLAAVLQTEPDWNRLPKNLHPRLRSTLERCLRKKVRTRYHAIADVRVDLEEVLDDPAGLAVSKPAETRAAGWRAGPIAAGLLVGALLAGGLVFALTRPEPAPVPAITRFVHALPPNVALNVPNVPAMDVSPDGRRVVYAAGGGLYLRNLDDLEARLIPGTENEVPTKPIFTPDGESIVYASVVDNQVKRVAVSGGTPIPLIDGFPGQGMELSGERVLTANSCVIESVPLTGGTPEILFEDTLDGRQCYEPTLLPGGNTALYFVRSASGLSEVVARSLESGETTTLFPGQQPYYLDPGRLVYFESTLGLIGRAFDPATLEFGAAVPLVSEPAVIDFIAQFAVADNGTLVYMEGGQSTGSGLRLAVVDSDGTVEALAAPPGDYRGPSVSPDGESVAVQIGSEGNAQIFVYELSGVSELRQLTFDGSNITPTWTPDGEWISYASNRDGRFRIYRQRADGSGSVEALTTPPDDLQQQTPTWAPDGRLAYTQTPVAGGVPEVWIVSPPDGEPELLVGGDEAKSVPSFSPRGDALAYMSVPGGTEYEIIVEPYPQDGSRSRVSEPGVISLYPVWSRDGSQLIWQTPLAASFAQAIDIRVPGFAITNRRGLPVGRASDQKLIDSMPDAGKLLAVLGPEQLAGSAAESPRIVIVENWLQELERLVPLPE